MMRPAEHALLPFGDLNVGKTKLVAYKDLVVGDIIVSSFGFSATVTEVRSVDYGCRIELEYIDSEGVAHLDSGDPANTYTKIRVI